MSTFATVIHVITCVLIVLVVLMQSGKGAEISATLGGSSQTVFGSSGGANFFTRLTFTLAAIFMATSLVLTVMGSRSQTSIFEGQAPAAATATDSAATTTAPTESAATTSAPTAPADAAKTAPSN